MTDAKKASRSLDDHFRYHRTANDSPHHSCQLITDAECFHVGKDSFVSQFLRTGSRRKRPATPVVGNDRAAPFVIPALHRSTKSKNVDGVPPPEPKLEPRLRFPNASAEAFGPGKAELLRHIAVTGSIRSAAKELGMSYNRAWLLVAAMNSLFRGPLVVSTRGGGTGGGAVLTPLGEEVLGLYARMEKTCLAATRRDWETMRRLLRR